MCMRQPVSGMSDSKGAGRWRSIRSSPSEFFRTHQFAKLVMTLLKVRFKNTQGGIAALRARYLISLPITETLQGRGSGHGISILDRCGVDEWDQEWVPGVGRPCIDAGR